MSTGLASVEPDGPLFRFGRAPDPWAWPDWSFAGPDGTFGNRYDDPEAGYRVLYASSQRLGAFLETLARFRPDLEVVAELEQIDGAEEPAPALPRSWLKNRLLGEATVVATSSTSATALRSQHFGRRWQPSPSTTHPSGCARPPLATRRSASAR